ncbi:MAG: hypothetical protein VYA34_00355 [Myxococcota bacterium]|nr:hypothetical protein [Myxococcota bacterium]
MPIDSVPPKTPLRPNPVSTTSKQREPTPPPIKSQEFNFGLLQVLHTGNPFSDLYDGPPIDTSHEKIGGLFPNNQPNSNPGTQFTQAIGIGAIHRTALFPLESITTRGLLGNTTKGNYFRGLPTSIVCGAFGKACSIRTNKIVRDSLEERETNHAILFGGIGAGAVETGLNPLSVIAQQAKVLPSKKVIPALRNRSLASYYHGGSVLMAQNLVGASIWFQGNALVRNEEDSLPIEATKSAAVAGVGGTLTWPAHVMHVQRIGTDKKIPTYTEIVKEILKKSPISGLKLNTSFPAGVLRTLISGAILGPLTNRLNEK